MSPVKIMFNGLPGNVAATIASHALKDKRFSVLPFSLTGPDSDTDKFTIGKTDFKLLKPETRENEINELVKTEGRFISIDYTHPTAVNENVKFYCDNNLPFVMGTTGGDRTLIHDLVLNSSIPAVIAPNMSKQIVGIQAMMEYAAKTFPGLFKGYSLDVVESHQSWKADTSGTAKAMIKYFNELGTDFSEDEIKKERDPEVQKNKWNIPVKYLDGHGWHTYTLDSPDKATRFAITHNISGRDIYAEGTLDGALYLQKKLSEGHNGIVYSMIDVLKQK
jgi:4-hydroxy-tetrahydrodipicolinate reductase